MSEIAEIADAVVKELNRGKWSEQFEARRRYRPWKNLDELGFDLHVEVLTLSQARLDSSRGSDRFDYSHGVHVFKRLEPGTTAPTPLTVEEQIDRLLDLVEELIDFFRERNHHMLTDYPNAELVGWTNEPVVDEGAMVEQGLFSSVLTLNFQTARDK